MKNLNPSETKMAPRHSLTNYARGFSLATQLMKTLTLLFIIALGLSTARADLGVTVYSGTTAQSPVKRGCTQIVLDMVGYSGVIGNATYSNVTHVVTVSVGRSGDTLGAISYTVTGGTLVIYEIR